MLLMPDTTPFLQCTIMRAIPLEQRVRIYTLLQNGYTSREVASREKVNHATVLRIRRKKEETDSFDVAPRSGRPRILTERHERNIAKLIRLGECSNVIQIQKKLVNDENTIISPYTWVVQKVLTQCIYLSNH